MRGEREPVTGGPDEADDALDGVRVEPIAPNEQKESSANQSISALSWTKRLSTRGKLARALIAMLAVLVALLVVLLRTSFTLPPQITRLLTPAPTQTRSPGRLSAGQLEQVPTPDCPRGRDRQRHACSARSRHGVHLHVSHAACPCDEIDRRRDLTLGLAQRRTNLEPHRAAGRHWRQLLCRRRTRWLATCGGERGELCARSERAALHP
jgi:hypothetical protein